MLLKEISVKELEQKYKKEKNAKIKQRLHILLLFKEGSGIKPKMNDEELSMFRSAIEEPLPIGDGYYRWWKSKDVRIFLNEYFGLDYTRQHICRN